MDHRTNARPHLWGMESSEGMRSMGNGDYTAAGIRAWWATSRQPEGAMSKHMPAEWWTVGTINGRAA
ncbi:hypothetical protein [Azospirillum himalayense]|uniref:Uncharacterized protein n=1 Tax=Azospirillum himalayense TaxID=654847 RepID=A0ABW0FXI9_9PROT